MRKKALTGWEQILAIILIVLALVALFFIIFKADILAKIKGLPGYGSSNEDDVAITTGKDIEIASTLCSVQVGNINGEGLSTDGDINFCGDVINQKDCGGNSFSHLKVAGEKIQIERTEWYMLWFDNTVGSLVNRKVSLNGEILNKNSKQYKILSGEGYYTSPDLMLNLKNLNGAKIVNGKELCRDKLITSV